MKNRIESGELGTTGMIPGHQGTRQPLKLEALSIYKQRDKLDAVQWFKAARVKLKNLASLGTLFSEEGAIAAIMDRTEVGSTIATWFQAQTNPEILTSMTVFETAFTRRFASGRTVEAALDRLGTIKSTSFADLDLFYTEFCDLTAIVGSQRSKPDLVRNFLDAVPMSMRLLIMVKNPGVRTTATLPIDELFLLAKEIAAAEKLVGGGTKQAVMAVEQQEGARNWHGGVQDVLPIGVNNLNVGRTSSCFNCKSTEHLARDCDKPRRCYNCNQHGHVQHNCQAPPREINTNRDFNRRNDLNRNDYNRTPDRRYPPNNFERDKQMGDSNPRPYNTFGSNGMGDSNPRPYNTLGSNGRGNWRQTPGGQPEDKE